MCRYIPTVKANRPHRSAEDTAIERRRALTQSGFDGDELLAPRRKYSGPKRYRGACILTAMITSARLRSLTSRGERWISIDVA